jgi:hypothetical protein
MAKILVTALYDNVSGGGSGGFMNCLIESLRLNKHDVIYSNNPQSLNPKDFDLSISSHQSKLKQIAEWELPKVHIMQGFVPTEEHPVDGANYYVSISPEVQAFARSKGYDSSVIRQPITIPKSFKTTLSKNILFIKNNATRPLDWQIPRLKLSDPNVPINNQITNSRACITLGRGALESMAVGRPVVIADNRFYQGQIGDGYITPENFFEIEKHNFSGRRFRIPATNEWINDQLSLYKPGDGKKLREIVTELNDGQKIAQQLVNLV